MFVVGEIKDNVYNGHFAGQIEDWKNHFTVAFNEEFDKEYIERMKGVQLDIDFE